MLVQRYALLAGALAFSGVMPAQTPVPVSTYRLAQSRAGYNHNETMLTWSNVNSTSFQKLFSYRVDGPVYAQPLYIPALSIAGTTRNVVFVATENNSVYAFDADNNGAGGGLLWRTNFNKGPAGVTVTPVPSQDVLCQDQGLPQIGITGTPVIDAATRTLYVVAKTKEVTATSTYYVQRLHALDLITGAEKFGGPVIIKGAVPGSCGYTDGRGNVLFSPRSQNQRAGLALVNGVVYIAWGSHCDQLVYNGWIMGYNAQTLQQVAVWNSTPDDPSDTCRGGVWMTGGAPSADAGGNLYVITGNGGFNANVAGGRSYGDSFVKLTPNATGALTVSDYFSPFYQASLNSADLDLGAQPPMLLPEQPGANPHLMVAAGKSGSIYLLNRDDLGGYNGSSNGIVQEIRRGVQGSVLEPSPMPGYVGGRVYFAAAGDKVKAFQLQNGLLSRTPAATSANTLGSRGAGMWTTSDPSGNNAILWALESGTAGILHAYKPDLTELYNSNQAGSRDSFGGGVKFSIPVVTNGKVYVGGYGQLVVFGLH